MGTIRVAFETMEECQKYLHFAQNFIYDLDLRYGSRIIDGKSALGILAFGLKKELYLKLHTDDVAAIEEFLEKIKFCTLKEDMYLAV